MIPTINPHPISLLGHCTPDSGFQKPLITFLLKAEEFSHFGFMVKSPLTVAVIIIAVVIVTVFVSIMIIVIDTLIGFIGAKVGITVSVKGTKVVSISPSALLHFFCHGCVAIEIVGVVFVVVVVIVAFVVIVIVFVVNVTVVIVVKILGTVAVTVFPSFFNYRHLLL